MGKLGNLFVIKLGGSVITNKGVPLSPSLENIRLIASELSATASSMSNLKTILIHGGGSFGHYYAKKFGLGTTVGKYSAEGVARTSGAMIKLHSILLDELCDSGFFCRTILPTELYRPGASGIDSGAVDRIEEIFANGLFPITFGFVNLTNSGAYIISGDKIAVDLASALHVTRTLFVMDVDGVYPSPKLKGDILPELFRENLRISSSVKKLDVTGGIRAKITAGFELADLGADVYFLNGAKPGRLRKALTNPRQVIATKIYSTKKSPPYS